MLFPWLKHSEWIPIMHIIKSLLLIVVCKALCGFTFLTSSCATIPFTWLPCSRGPLFPQASWCLSWSFCITCTGSPDLFLLFRSFRSWSGYCLCLQVDPRARLPLPFCKPQFPAPLTMGFGGFGQWEMLAGRKKLNNRTVSLCVFLLCPPLSSSLSPRISPFLLLGAFPSSD